MPDLNNVRSYRAIIFFLRAPNLCQLIIVNHICTYVVQLDNFLVSFQFQSILAKNLFTPSFLFTICNSNTIINQFKIYTKEHVI